ncbi:unnamed protein product [Brassicogethes aeneus]|uniref:Uncharacterized protein n=1 Tax=Brassicogethes aeneus TaxID=1431903 RepID=A0A9P0B4Z1_BRAAE|nr:unnamed protein product [Brassicogethes aeneus]
MNTMSMERDNNSLLKVDGEEDHYSEENLPENNELSNSPLTVMDRKEEKMCNDKEHRSALEVLNQIKTKFQNSSVNSEKVQLLTLAPKSWGRRRLALKFGASERQARKAKNLVERYGILSKPDPKKGRLLPEQTKNLVISSYTHDENSRMMPGMKDYVSIRKDDGSREHVQKRLVLCNLAELYSNFQLKYPNVRIGLSKFSQIRPRNCVLAGASGTHTVDYKPSSKPSKEELACDIEDHQAAVQVLE